jgi:hypothetical protein
MWCQSFFLVGGNIKYTYNNSLIANDRKACVNELLNALEKNTRLYRTGTKENLELNLPVLQEVVNVR